MRKIMLAVLLLACTGCFRITYQVTPSAGDTYKNWYWNTYFVFGLVPVEESYDLDAFCRSGHVREIRTYQSPTNVLASFLGILTEASTVEAVCVKDVLKEQSLPLTEKPAGQQKRRSLWGF